jgi:hypothetical protein
MDGPSKLRVTRSLPQAAERFDYATQLLERLSPAGS